MKTIRWGLIGCGEVAETKSGPGFYRAANSQLVAVADRNAARAEDFARRHGVARWHDDADAIIRAPDIDAVYVATMTESHRDFVLRCAAAGKPVLSEKPMAMNHADCHRDDRGVPRSGRPAMGRVLPARAAALPRRPRPGAKRRDRCPPHGDHAPLPAASDAGADARPLLGLAARPRTLRRRHLLRSRWPHPRHPGLHPRADRNRARLRGQPGGRLPAGGRRDGRVPLRLRGPWQRGVVLHRRLRRRIQRDRRRERAHPVFDVPAARTSCRAARRCRFASCAAMRWRKSRSPTRPTFTSR